MPARPEAAVTHVTAATGEYGLALDGQRRDGVARHMDLSGTGDRRRQQLSRRKVENQLVVSDAEVLVMRRVEAGPGQDRRAETGLTSHLPLHDRKDRVQWFAVRRKKRVEGDRLV